ncbi:MAG: P-II family nitrogen regulator [Actinomycetota bacterium]
MKLVAAVINHFKLEDVKDALHEIGIDGMTVSDVRGFGRQKGHTEIYRGAEYQVELLPKTKVETIVGDDEVPTVVKAIMVAANTGAIGDGKVWVTPIEELARIRTGEKGEDAL